MGGDNFYEVIIVIVHMRVQFYFFFIFFYKIIDRQIRIREKSIVVTSCNSFTSSWVFFLIFSSFYLV